MVVRLGGDELAVLQSGGPGYRGIAALSEMLISAFANPLVINGPRIRITASIGATVLPGDIQDPEHGLQTADDALYRAKASGESCFVLAPIRARSIEHSGLIPAARFIHAAQQHGMIHSILKLSLREACRVAATWTPRAPGLPISINLPASTLRSADLAATIADALGDAGLTPDRLEVVAVGVETMGQLEWLRHAGCQQAQGNQLGPPVQAEAFSQHHLC